MGIPTTSSIGEINITTLTTSKGYVGWLVDERGLLS